MDLFSDDEDIERAIHWSKGNLRQRAIIDAREALGVEPDGYLHWFNCDYCEHKWGTKTRLSYPRNAECPNCLNPTTSDIWYPLYLLHEGD